jgi:hypothetical protein
MAYRRIHSKGPYQYDECEAGGSITPGHLVMVDNDGKLYVHNEAGGRGEVAFAIEDALQGGAVGDAYASGEQACYILPGKGCEVHARLATGQTCVKGEELVSNGDGTLKVRGTGASGVTEWQTIAIAMEAKTSTDNDLIRVRVV